MFKLKEIFGGLFGGVIGGAVIDLIFITFAGPSSLFSLMGITGRINVFLGHLILGGILGVLFVLILRKLPRLNIWLAGVLFGLICFATIGGIPTMFTDIVNPKMTIFGFIVWLLFGIILAGTVKFFKEKII